MTTMGERFVVQAMPAERFTDPENARLLYLAAGGLALAGLLLLAVTVWWWRTSRVENPVLAPLEVMGWRKWVRSTWSERKRLVDDVRPEDSLALSDAPSPPVEIDLRGLLALTPESFDDLREGYVAPVAAADSAASVAEPAAADGSGDVADVGDAGELPDNSADSLGEDHSEQLDLGLASMTYRLEMIADGHVDPDDESDGEPDAEADGSGDPDVGEQLAMTLDPLLRGGT